MSDPKEASSAESLMTDAIEGAAIAYWAIVRNIVRDVDTGCVTSFDVRNFESADVRWVRVNEKALRKAASKLLNGEVEVRRDIAAQFIGKNWEYDDEGIDCVIQARCFNEIVFG